MFPTLKVRLRGLDPVSQYIVYMDLIPYDDKRYRYVYHSSQWMVAGAGDPPPSIGQVGLTGGTLRNGLELSRLEGRKLSYARQGFYSAFLFVGLPGQQKITQNGFRDTICTRTPSCTGNRRRAVRRGWRPE